MNEERRKELEDRGFTVTDAYTFLGLTEEDKSVVDLRRELSALTEQFRLYKEKTDDRIDYLEDELDYSIKNDIRSIQCDIGHLDRIKQDIGE